MTDVGTERNIGRRLTGRYRGSVVSPVDPLKKGRLLVKVPDALGEIPAFWAEAATPYGGQSCGMYVIPPPNAGVWVEFENGDVERPVWTGFYRDNPSEVPPVAMTQPEGVPFVALGTVTNNYLLISDVPGPTGGIQLQLHGPGGPYIKLNETGVEISAGPGLASIQLIGPAVIVNKGALTVDAPA
jgi:Type VI secretion system/phage-baseplate injector OB domain